MDIKKLTKTQEDLLKKHLPLVRHLAGKMAARLPPSVDIEDLEAAGRFGLFQAVQSFDPAAGFSFSTFSKNRISGAMLDGIRDMDWIGRAFRAKDVELPTMCEFSAFENRERDEAFDPADNRPLPDAVVASADTVRWFLDRLPAREARVIWAYHGPDSMTHREIAEELGISEGRVNHLYHRAVKKMRYLAQKLDIDPSEQ